MLILLVNVKELDKDVFISDITLVINQQKSVSKLKTTIHRLISDYKEMKLHCFYQAIKPCILLSNLKWNLHLTIYQTDYYVSVTLQVFIIFIF